MTDMTIPEQIERLKNSVASFTRIFGRKPVLILDSDGVIYQWEKGVLAHFHKHNPNLPPIEGPFRNWDTTTGRTPEQAAALLRTLDKMDYSELEPYPASLAVIPLLVEVGFDVYVATSHSTANLYCAAAKVYAFHRDFNGLLDQHIAITLDKTRLIGDWLVDDKPEVIGRTDVPPTWQHVYFTQAYNEHLDGPRLVWETALPVLADLVEAKVNAALNGAAPGLVAQAVQGTWSPLSGADPTNSEPAGADEPAPSLFQRPAAPAWEADAEQAAAEAEFEPAAEPVEPVTTVAPVVMPWDEDEAAGSAPEAGTGLWAKPEDGHGITTGKVADTWDSIVSGKAGDE